MPSLNQLERQYPEDTLHGQAVRMAQRASRLLQVWKLRKGLAINFEPATVNGRSGLCLEMGHREVPHHHLYFYEALPINEGPEVFARITLISYGGRVLNLAFEADNESPSGLQPVGRQFDAYHQRGRTLEALQSEIKEYLLARDMGPWYKP